MLRELPQFYVFPCSHENISPSAVMLRELPQFYVFPCSHGNISFHKTGKKLGNKKRVVYVRGDSRTHVFS